MGNCRSACQAAMTNRTATYGRTAQPFIITLDENASNLCPGTGEMQRFCYQVSVNGSGNLSYLPLEYMVLGLNCNITADDFAALSVRLNGNSQTVIWGENAVLLSASSPDSGTGCAGLRLSFPLTSSADELNICFTLARTFTVNSMDVCLYSGNGSVSTISVAGPAADAQETDCPTTTYQEVDVCVPVTIAPYATVGEASVTCCGEPTITSGVSNCGGTEGGTCSFTVSQRVCVAVPVTFGANTDAGNYAVTCGTAAEGTCENCGDAAVETSAAAQSSRSGNRCSCNCNSGCGCRTRRTSSTSVTQTTLSDVINGTFR